MLCLLFVFFVLQLCDSFPLKMQNGMCMDVFSSCSNRNGCRVELWPCNNARNQDWQLRGWSGARIISGQGKCLDVHRDDWTAKRNGARIQVWECNGGDNQKWNIKGGQIRSSNGLCLNAHAPDYNNRRSGTRLQLWRCGDKPNAFFFMGNRRDTLRAPGSLSAPSMLVSRNGMYALYVQPDRNLVIYHRNGKALWSSSTNSRSFGARLSMQADNNLVLYAGNRAIWSTSTNNRGSRPARLVMQSDGNLVVYDRSNRAIWASGTNGRSLAFVFDFVSDFSQYLMAGLVVVNVVVICVIMLKRHRTKPQKTYQAVELDSECDEQEELVV